MNHQNLKLSGKVENSQRRVFVDGVEITPEASQKIRNHSQEFSWGYEGSGPAQLALSILLSIVGEEAWKYYQYFKSNVIAKIKQDEDFEAVVNLNEFFRDMETRKNPEHGMSYFISLEYPNTEQPENEGQEPPEMVFGVPVDGQKQES